MRGNRRCRQAVVVVVGAVALFSAVAAAADEKVAVSAAPQATRAAVARKAEFDRQWKEVRAKQPLVAMRLLELLGAALAAQRELPCELESLQASSECRRQEAEDCGPAAREPQAPCRRCRPPGSSEDIEGYLECLEERIDCLT